MDFTSTLVAKLKARGLTDSSVSLYVRNLEKLNGNKVINNLNIFNIFYHYLIKILNHN